ncbi:MAG TPA: hypothetical protein VGP08_09395 [Pyrinomonadaceae bacterium]|nr:hypothetical protein [Pyrinomonadaceae bacterium]
MKQLKRFAVACILIASLSAVVMADGGDGHSPGDPAPGIIHTPGIASPGETSTLPGDSHTPGSAVVEFAAWLAALL